MTTPSQEPLLWLENLKDSLVPVSWAMYKEVCGKYDPIK